MVPDDGRVKRPEHTFNVPLGKRGLVDVRARDSGALGPVWCGIGRGQR